MERLRILIHRVARHRTRLRPLLAAVTVAWIAGVSTVLIAAAIVDAWPRPANAVLLAVAAVFFPQTLLAARRWRR